MIRAGVFIMKMAQKFPTLGLVIIEQEHCLIVLTRVKTYNNHRSLLYNVSSSAYESCVIVVRGDRYRVEHNRFGLDVSNCRRCICQNGQLNDSTCVNGHSCVFITPGGGPKSKSCNYNGTEYSSGEVFPVDECNTCKCLDGKISGCTRTECNMNTTCEQCMCMPVDPVCYRGQVRICNACEAEVCAGLDPSEFTSGPCQTLEVISNFVT